MHTGRPAFDIEECIARRQRCSDKLEESIRAMYVSWGLLGRSGCLERAHQPDG